jgi:hypothetical protein
LNNERINGRRKYERNVFVDGKLISKSNRPDYSKWKEELKSDGKLKYE